MRYLFIVASFFFSCYSYASVSIATAQNVFTRLQQITHTHYKLSVAKTSEINAEFNGFGVVINTGMLRFLNNKNELSQVLGHELTHRYTSNESKADYGGFVLANKAGYNSCVGINIFKRFAKLDGNKKTDRVHPKYLDRYNALVRWCK